MKIGEFNIHFHSISAHFTNALYPVAVLFLILFKIFHHDSFRSTYYYLILLALISTPITFMAGLIEWKQKYKGARVKIFIRKYTGGVILMGAGSIIAVWNYISPEIIKESGLLSFIFILLNFAIILLVAYLGYLGGKLVFGGTH
jgi:uncharacterized membrane protein